MKNKKIVIKDPACVQLDVSKIQLSDSCEYRLVRAAVRKSVANRQFIVALYGAYNDRGKVNTAKNGIVILDGDNSTVVCDEMAREIQGWSGPSRNQVHMFRRLCRAPWPKFKDLINGEATVRSRL